MWNCPKCKREFTKANQSHSCSVFPLEKHFENKESVRLLFDSLASAIKSTVGEIKIESVPCCIHFVNGFTFAAVWAMKDKLRMDFRVDHTIADRRIVKEVHLSANRYLYYVNIENETEIDGQLLGWIKEAYRLQNK